MFTLGKFFPLPGSFIASSFAGALNACGSVRERDRWIPGYLCDMQRLTMGAATRDACDAFERVRHLAKGCKRRQVKRAVVRIARQARIKAKQQRGAHWRHWR